MWQSTTFEILITLLGVLAAVLVAMLASQGLGALPLRCVARRQRRLDSTAWNGSNWPGDKAPRER